MKKFIIPFFALLFLAFQNDIIAQDDLVEKGGYSLNSTEEHHFLFVLKNNPADLPEVRAGITKYIWKYHPTDKLKVTQIKIGGELETTPLIHISSFSDQATAMKFYAGLKKNRPDFLQMGMTEDYFALSKSNYEAIIRAKTLKGYKPFFNLNYVSTN